MDNFFNGSPVILPIGDDAPTHFPRIILKTDDDKYNCNLSTRRIDIFYKDPSYEKELVDVVPDYKELLTKIISFINDKASIDKLGVVPSYVLPDIDINYLRNNFCGPDRFSEANNILIQTGEKISENSFDLNLIQRLSVQTINDAEVIHVQYDFNAANTFNSETAITFFDDMINKAEERLESDFHD